MSTFRTTRFLTYCGLSSDSRSGWLCPYMEMTLNAGVRAETRRNAGSRGFNVLLRNADAVTACSRYLLGEAVKFENSIAPKALVIHNGIEPERFDDTSPYPHPRPYVLAYGRLAFKKGFDLLVRSFAKIATSRPNLDLVIAGEGEQRSALERLSARSGIGGRVYFYGRASQPEIIRLLNGCRMVVVPSRQEPFGIAALEALAAGRPVLLLVWAGYRRLPTVRP